MEGLGSGVTWVERWKVHWWGGKKDRKIDGGLEMDGKREDILHTKEIELSLGWNSRNSSSTGREGEHEKTCS